jgi:predicted RNase H-like nuclease (RuvC/YqgF family)
LESAEHKFERIKASRAELRKENSQIISELDKVNKNNLIYRQKIESSSADIADRDATISGLQKELNKTVVASTNAKRDASNRDEEVKQLKSELSSSDKTISELESRIVACEDLLFEYQQAYADFYATARGISVSGLSITASTSVSELKDLIQGATNTSNISAMPRYDISEDDFIGNPVDVVDGVEDNQLATL